MPCKSAILRKEKGKESMAGNLLKKNPKLFLKGKGARIPGESDPFSFRGECDKKGTLHGNGRLELHFFSSAGSAKKVGKKEAF